MVDFEYYTPTKVVFGKGSEEKVGQLTKEEGATKVLVHFGGESARRSGLLDKVCKSLDDAGLGYVQLGGVVPNPHIDLVRQGVELCKKEGVDFVLAVGGGSVIDSAKAIAFGVAGGRDAWDYFSGAATPEAALPVAAVLTIAAAGSEMSNSAVITNTETGEKRGVGSKFGRCKFAIMNPELTLTLSAEQTSIGCADILMHTMERYFTNNETMQITDGMAEALLRVVMSNAKKLARKPESYNARAEIMWAGSISHNGLLNCGGGAGDWSSHQLAHEISGRFDTPHGAALTVVWGSWARYVYKQNPARFVDFAVRVLELEEEATDEETALAAIEEMESFFWGLSLPTSFIEAGISLTDGLAEQMALGCSRQKSSTIGAFQKLGYDEILAIYKMAK